MNKFFGSSIRLGLACCAIFLFWPGFSAAESLVDIAIHLGSRPEDSLNEFEEQVHLSFDQPVMLQQIFGPSDVPEGHYDPLYWSVVFTSFVDGHKFWAKCNRIGPESIPLITKSKSEHVDSSKSFREMLDETKTLQGSWADVTPVFLDGTKTRLDCLFNSPQPIGKKAATDSLSKHFSEINSKSAPPDLFGPDFYFLEAENSVMRSSHIIDRATVSSIDVSGTEVTITAWHVGAINEKKD